MLNASKFILNCKPLTIEELASNPETVIDGMIVEGTGGMFRTKSGKYAAVMPASWLTLFGEQDFRLIPVAATRYSLGRHTYMPNVVSDFLIKHIDLLDKKTLALIIDSIELHLVDYAEYEPYPSLWRNLEERLKARQSVLDTEEGGTK